MSPRRLAFLSVTVIVFIIGAVGVYRVEERPLPLPSITLGPGLGPQKNKVLPYFKLPVIYRAAFPNSSSSWSNANFLESSSLEGKPTLLVFFASWCSECKEELPLIGQAVQLNHSRINIIGIDSGDSTQNALTLLRDDGANFEVLSDPSQNIAKQYDLRGLPYSVLSNKNGLVIQSELGGLTKAKLNTMIEVVGGNLLP